jgi:hypothetical protein
VAAVAVSNDLGDNGGSRQWTTAGNNVGDDAGNDVGDGNDGGNNAGNNTGKRDGRDTSGEGGGAHGGGCGDGGGGGCILQGLLLLIVKIFLCVVFLSCVGGIDEVTPPLTLSSRLRYLLILGF